MPNAPKKPRGRPRGETEQGAATRRQLYETAIALIASRGYEATTLRAIAEEAGVSVGLLYRYFPSKRALVLALYDALSAEYAARAETMRAGPWRERFLFALRSSLAVLGPHRGALIALTSTLVGDVDEGLFAQETAFSRERVRGVFVQAVTGAADAPDEDDAAALGRLLYLAHLAVILFWLLDKSPRQRATERLLSTLEELLPLTNLVLGLDPIRASIRTFDALVREALFGE